MINSKAEAEFLSTYNKERYDRPSVTVDFLVFTIVEEKLKVVMVRRKEMPFQGYLSLPGVFVGMDETLDEAATRGIKEETGLTNIYLEQLYTWGDIKRDPRMRIISVSYIALVPFEQIKLVSGKRVSEVHLYSIKDLLKEEDIAFDHKKMIQYGLERIKNKAEYTKIPFEFVPEEFTLPQLQKVYEILLGRELYKANFRKSVISLLEQTEHMTSGDTHRPSRYYRLKREEAAGSYGIQDTF